MRLIRGTPNQVIEILKKDRWYLLKGIPSKTGDTARQWILHILQIKRDQKHLALSATISETFFTGIIEFEAAPLFDFKPVKFGDNSEQKKGEMKNHKTRIEDMRIGDFKWYTLTADEVKSFGHQFIGSLL